MNNAIQADYDQLDAIAARFGQSAEAIDELYRQVRRAAEDLLQDGWKGRGSDAFASEMSATLLPALQRLKHALEVAQKTTSDSGAMLHAAEAEAAALFVAQGEYRNTRSSASEASNPDFGDVDNTKGVKYDVIKGHLTIGSDNETDIHPNDITQGGLGDCYFLASMAAIAKQNPELIKNMIQDNKDGTYTVTFYERRSFYEFWKPEFEAVKITVDNTFPVRDGSPIFSQPGDTSGDEKELWPMIAEKAYAKWRGGYGDIEGGWPHDAMEQITGASSHTYDPASINIHDLANYQKQGFAITADTHYDSKLTLGDYEIIDFRDKTDTTLYTKNKGPLVPDHSYYVTNVNEETKTVTLRNPWGWNRGETMLTFDQFKKGFQRISTNPIKKEL